MTRSACIDSLSCVAKRSRSNGFGTAVFVAVVLLNTYGGGGADLR
jgi:hypothetical protein